MCRPESQPCRPNSELRNPGVSSQHSESFETTSSVHLVFHYACGISLEFPAIIFSLMCAVFRLQHCIEGFGNCHVNACHQDCPHTELSFASTHFLAILFSLVDAILRSELQQFIHFSRAAGLQE